MPQKGERKAAAPGVLRSFKCMHCIQPFSSVAERREHIAAHHAKPFMCTDCRSTFGRKWSLEQHLLTVHSKVKPHACGMCHLTFGQKGHLLRHQKAVHVKVRDFNCLQCNAQFFRKEHMSNHVRSVHEGAKPYQCILCDAEYSEKRGLRRHLESLHRVNQERSTILASFQPDAKESIPRLALLLHSAVCSSPQRPGGSELRPEAKENVLAQVENVLHGSSVPPSRGLPRAITPGALLSRPTDVRETGEKERVATNLKAIIAAKSRVIPHGSVQSMSNKHTTGIYKTRHSSFVTEHCVLVASPPSTPGHNESYQQKSQTAEKCRSEIDGLGCTT